MAKNFSTLRTELSPQARKKSAALARKMLKEMPLHELRQARGLSQLDLARLLNVQQPAIAKLERRTDMYLSTLRNHIEALGGQLEILAKFPEGEVRITNFSSIGEADAQNNDAHLNMPNHP
jgi:ribosome-binding protein aMBF1 (putative translation factor)